MYLRENFENSAMVKELEQRGKKKSGGDKIKLKKLQTKATVGKHFFREKT